MLYVTTRNDRDTFTVQQTLKNERGPDGGQFIPYRSSVFSREEVNDLLKLPFDQCMAKVLNRLLDLNLSGWDLSFYVGRRPVRIRNLGYRTMIAESWHNPDWCFDRVVQNIMHLVSRDGGRPTQWLQIAVRTAVFAAICAENNRSGIRTKVDCAVMSGDFFAPMAAWYTRSWGFPIGSIVCCCNENGNLWDLIANGQLRTDGISVLTDTPAADAVIPVGLEQLIYGCGGTGEVHSYVDAYMKGKTYVPADTALKKLREVIYVCVVGNQRMLDTISRAYASRNYLLSPYDALCYCGVSDYRARFGETGEVLIFSERSPICDRDTVAKAMGISIEEVKNYL